MVEVQEEVEDGCRINGVTTGAETTRSGTGVGGGRYPTRSVSTYFLFPLIPLSTVLSSIHTLHT